MSSINPNNIDGTYPIAGQDNDSQGFRNNFTNIRNNLTFAKSEIEALEQNVILKSALPGLTLDNDMNNTPLVGAQIREFTETLRDIGPQSGTITVNWSDAHFQLLEITANTTVTLSDWSTSGFYSSMVLDVTPTVDNAYLTLAGFTNPLVNATNIQGFSGNTIPLTTGNVSYRFEFSTYDSGATVSVRDLYRNYDFAADFDQLNVTGNVLASGAIVNSLTVNGTTTVVDVNSTGFINTTGNVSAAAVYVGEELVVTGVFVDPSNTFEVSIADNGSGSQTVFYLDGTALKDNTGATFGLRFYPGNTYRFDLSDVTNALVPLKFSTTPDTAVPASITPYTTGVTNSTELAGNAGAYVQITIESDTPTLYLYADDTDAIIDTSLIGAALPIGSGIDANGDSSITGDFIVTGNLTVGGAKIDTGYQYSAATTNFDDTVGASVSRVIYNPAGTLANGTLTLPEGNVEAKVVTVSSTQTITAFRVNPSAGTTLIPNANVTLSAGTSVSYFYHASETKWYKIG